MIFKKYFKRILRLIIFNKIKIYIFFLIIFIYKLNNFYRSLNNLNDVNTKIQFSDEKIQTFDYLSQYERIKSFKKKFASISGWKNIVPIQKNLFKNNSKNLLILEYTKIFGSSKYCQKFDQNIVDAKNYLYLNECPFKNCIFSCDKNLLNNAQAIIFHQADLEEEIKYNNDYLKNLNMVAKQRNNQTWILWNDEANKVDENLDAFFFNWTMSYRIDSEVSDCSYGCIYRKIIKNNENFYQKIKLSFESKKNQAVWFVSNCGPKFRINFAKSLKKFFPVKVFGACSNYFESFFSSIFKDDCSRETKCEQEQLSQNKFYLSFESKNCSNYLTEKVWKMLHIGIIPVVIQPSKTFYEINLPPNSFIHAQDFDFNVEKLANYLNFVANDFDTYYRYLKWKDEYDVVFTSFQTERRRLCELCTRLNNQDSAIYYKSVSSFFNDKCIIN